MENASFRDSTERIGCETLGKKIKVSYYNYIIELLINYWLHPQLPVAAAAHPVDLIDPGGENAEHSLPAHCMQQEVGHEILPIAMTIGGKFFKKSAIKNTYVLTFFACLCYVLD